MLEPPECSRPDDSEGDGGRLLIVGSRRDLRRLGRSALPWRGLPIIGLVATSGRSRQVVFHPASAPVPVLGRLDRLARVVERSRPTDVVVAATGGAASKLRSEMDGLARRKVPVRIHWVDNPGAPASTSGPVEGPSNDVTSRAPWSILAHRAAKRGLDMAAALIALLVLSPLLLAVSIAILVSDGRPIFYSQERIGRGGRRFRIWKFRSMRRDAEAETGPIWAEEHDRRCTKLGDWLRHTNIDELPQLFNILMGDMSLVGPRPERPVFVEQFRGEHADYDLRHVVPIGMTGWAQVHGWRGRTSLRKRLQYDLDYIDRWSIWLDLRILWMTVEHVFWKRTSWANSKPRRPEP